MPEQTEREPMEAARRAADKAWDEFKVAMRPVRRQKLLAALAIEDELRLREIRQGLRDMRSAIEGYAETNGWTELSDGILREYQRIDELLAKLEGRDD